MVANITKGVMRGQAVVLNGYMKHHKRKVLAKRKKKTTQNSKLESDQAS